MLTTKFWLAGDENPRDKKIQNDDKLQETNNDQVNSSHVSSSTMIFISIFVFGSGSSI